MATDLLAAARKSKRVSQSELARKSGIFQPNISLIEKGLTDPGIDTINLALSYLGSSLQVLPTRSKSVAQIALQIEQALRDKKEKQAFRLFIQLNDYLLDADPSLCSALTIYPPTLVGDQRYDALIAGVVEYYLRKKSMPVHKWVNEPERKLKEFWIVDPYQKSHAVIERKTPKEFLRRKVLLAESELASV